MPRRAVLALLVAFAFLPFAAAQVPGTPLDPVQNPLRVTAAGDVQDVRPLSGGGSTALTVEVYCTALDPQAPTDVALSIESAPDWVVATPAPQSVQFPANAPPPCANEWKAEQALLFVAAAADAPAYEPGQIVVLATMKDKTARAFVNATAAAYTEIDAAASETQGVATPGEPWEFTVTVTNRGNHKVAVDLATGAPKGVKVEAAGGEVGSLAAGDASNQGTFTVTVTPEASVVNGRYPVWVNATATVPGKPDVRAARESLALTADVQGAALPPEAQEEKGLPVPFALAPLAVAGAAVAVRRSR